MAAVPSKPKEQASDEIASLRQQVETLKQDVSIWKASSEKWAQRHAEVHAQVETLTQELQAQAANHALHLRIERATGYKDGYASGLAKRPRDDRAAYQQGRSAPSKTIKKLRVRIAELEARDDVSRQIIDERTACALKAEQQLASLAAAQERMTAELRALEGEIGNCGNAGYKMLMGWADRLHRLHSAALPSLAASSRETTKETKD